MVSLAELENPAVVVTSAHAGEGKTATCARLAQALARSGQRVVLVDLDLRHPDVHRWIGAANDFGVSDVLLNERTLDSCLQFVEAPGRGAKRGIYFLSAGKPVHEPTELLGTARLKKLLEGLGEQADVVLLDTPPVLPVADTLVIGRMAGGVIIVAESRRTPAGAVLKVKDALVANRARPLGVVLNKLQARDVLYGYGYGYGMTQTEADGGEKPRADSNGHRGKGSSDA
ncbi:CpsD/CapB family tyrosine-protein kinase [soil metagenome]